MSHYDQLLRGTLSEVGNCRLITLQCFSWVSEKDLYVDVVSALPDHVILAEEYQEFTPRWFIKVSKNKENRA